MSLPELVIVGDEAWTREEWEAEQKRRESDRAWKRAYSKSPKAKARQAAYHREWVKRNVEHVRAYKRQYAHAERSRLVGSLHHLSCTGPTQDTGCKCNARGTAKIRCYDKPR